MQVSRLLPKFMQLVNDTASIRLMPSANEVGNLSNILYSCLSTGLSNPNLDILKATREMRGDSLFHEPRIL